MDRIGVIGISWTRGGTEALARFTIPLAERPEGVARLARAVGADELVYLATCNRVEVAVVTDGQTPVADYRPRLFEALAGHAPGPGEAERTFRAWAGEGAVEHLFLVAAGLDSARPGETEIAGQLRTAVDLARSLRLTGTRLELVLEEALKVAGKIHQATSIGEGKVSLAEIAIDHVRARLARTPGALALVGVSPMTQRCGRALAGGGARLLVVNRTPANAQAFADEVGGEVRGLAAFREEPDACEALVLATGAKDPVLTRATLEKLASRCRSGEPPLVVDMAVPPDVLPEDAATAGLTRIGMDDVIREAEQNRRERMMELGEARALVDEALAGLRRRLADRLMSPLIATLQKRYQRTALEGVERLFRKELGGLGDTERAAVTRWAETLARRFAHIPSVGLRSLAEELGSGAVEAFLCGLEDELARELRGAAAGSSGMAVPTEEEAT